MAPSRRDLLGKAGLLGAGLLLGQLLPAAAEAAPIGPLLRARLQACSPRSQPLQALLEGNQRFVAAWAEARQAASPQLRMQALKQAYNDDCQIDPQALAKGQRPWAAVLSCADARVPVEWLFNAGAGELFQVRIAGNSAFDDGIASLEYAVDSLQVPLVLVLGHSGCGAVQAAMGQGPLSPLLETLVAPIRASLLPGDDLTGAIQANARYAAAQLPQRSALLSQAQARGKLSIQPAYFEIASGQVSLL